MRFHTYCDTSPSVAAPASASTSVAAASGPIPSRWIDARGLQPDQPLEGGPVDRPAAAEVGPVSNHLDRNAPELRAQQGQRVAGRGVGEVQVVENQQQRANGDSSHKAATTPSISAKPVAAVRTPELDDVAGRVHSGTSASTTPGATRRTASTRGFAELRRRAGAELYPRPHQRQPDAGRMRGPRHRHSRVCLAGAETVLCECSFPDSTVASQQDQAA